MLKFFFIIWLILSINWSAFSLVLLRRRNPYVDGIDYFIEFITNMFYFPYHFIKEMRKKSED